MAYDPVAAAANTGKAELTHEQKQAEHVLRLLAGTINVVKLYPLPAPKAVEAAALFATEVNKITLQGMLRYRVSPEKFMCGGVEVGRGNDKIGIIAQKLYSLQVGELIITSGLISSEVGAFITVYNSRSDDVRNRGGISAVFKTLGLVHIGIVSISANEEDAEAGLFGLDMLTAPLPDISTALAEATVQWSALDDIEVEDDVALVLDRVEPALKEIALGRMGSSLLLLDEDSRLRMLGNSLRKKPSGRSMRGTLEVFVAIKPFALVHLLTLFAIKHRMQVGELLRSLPLPPETLRRLVSIFNATSSTDRTKNAGAEIPSAEMLATAIKQPIDIEALNQQLAGASLKLATERALGVAIAVSRDYPSLNSVTAIGTALMHALGEGAFLMVEKALLRLEELSHDYKLEGEVRKVKKSILDREVLFNACQFIKTEYNLEIMGGMLASAGSVGGDVAFDILNKGDENTGELLRPLIFRVQDAFTTSAIGRLRTDLGTGLKSVVKMLGVIKTRGSIQALGEAVQHPSEQVRLAAITALAEIGGPEVSKVLVSTLEHDDIVTSNFAVQEMRRKHITDAVPQLALLMEERLSTRKYFELQKQIINALETIGTPESTVVLKQIAKQQVAWTWRQRVIRSLAKAATDRLSGK